MGSHDVYGKALMRAACGDAYTDFGASVRVDYGSRQPARIDGTVGDIAVEIESRVSKQVRGAVLDLICHPLPKKLLVLLPAHMTNPADTAVQCRNIMRRFLDPESFHVLLLTGTGDRPEREADVPLVAAAIRELTGS